MMRYSRGSLPPALRTVSLASLNCVAVGAVLHQVRRGLVDVLGEGEVLHVDLAGAAPAAGMEGTGLAHAPGPGEDVDLFLVGLVLGLALDVVDLDEHVNSHFSTPRTIVRLLDGNCLMETLTRWRRARR